MNATATTRTAAILASASLALTATGSEVRFLDTTGDHDLANAANWDPSSWTASDTLLVSTANATIPTTGLHLSTDMPASGAIKFGAFPNANVLVDFGGHSLNTEDLVFSQMHDDNNRFKYLLASGGFSGVKTIRLNESHKGHVRFTNGVFRVEKGVKMGNWYPYLHVCAGAELIVTKIVEDQVGMSGAQKGEFRINGGKFLVEARESANWRRSYWNGNLSTFMIENGGEYRDISPYSANSFRGIDVTIRDSGYYETNSFFIVRNTGFFDKAKYEITNSVFRVGQLYFGPYQVSGAYNSSDVSWYLYDSTVDFCDSEETFAFRWDQTKVSTGVIVPPSAQNNTILFRGGKNRFTSKTFVLGGSNTVAVTGGSFDVSNSFSFVEAQAGSGSRLILKDADVYLASLSVSANAADALVEIAGTASVDVAQLTLASETTFKFVISGEGFAAAPIQFGSVSASGKARFAFDMADYDWPKKRANIPLVSHRGGFVGWEDGGLALDVGVLTEDHAGALPVNSKAGKCSFRLSADGKTLFLSVPGTAKGTMIVVN